MEMSDVVYALPLLILGCGSVMCSCFGLTPRRLWGVAQGAALAAFIACIGSVLLYVLGDAPRAEPIFRLNPAA